MDVEACDFYLCQQPDANGLSSIARQDRISTFQVGAPGGELGSATTQGLGSSFLLLGCFLGDTLRMWTGSWLGKK